MGLKYLKEEKPTLSRLFRHHVSGKVPPAQYPFDYSAKKGGKSYLRITNIKLRLKAEICPRLFSVSQHIFLSSSTEGRREKNKCCLFFSRKIVSVEDEAPSPRYYFISMCKRLGGGQERRTAIGE